MGLPFSHSLCITSSNSYEPNDFSSDSKVEVGEATHIRVDSLQWWDAFELNSNLYERCCAPYVWLLLYLSNIYLVLTWRQLFDHYPFSVWRIYMCQSRSLL